MKLLEELDIFEINNTFYTKSYTDSIVLPNYPSNR